MGAESIYRHFKGTQCVAKVAERGTDTIYGPVLGYLLYEKAGDVEHALKEFHAALEKAPNDPDLLLRVGASYVAINKPTEALPMLKKVVES